MQEAKANGSMSSSSSSAGGGKENSPQKNAAAGGSEQKRLFITHVQASGPYLQVAGQLNPDAAAVVHTKMQQLLAKCSAIDAAWDAERQVAALRVGSLAIHKVVKGAAPDDHDLYRAKILRVISGAKGITVEVEYVDYGYTKQVASHELHMPQHEVLQQIPVLGGRYILCGICKDWEPQEIATIEDMILQKMVDVRIEMEFNAFKFITMKWKEFDFSEYLVHHKKMGAPIANNLLRDNFVKYYQLNQQQQQHQQRGEATPSTVTNNNSIATSNNNNHHNNNNTNDYRKTNFGQASQNNNNNNNNLITNNKNNVSVYPTSNQKYAKYPSDVLAPPMAAYQAPFQPKRSLQNRLQRYQNPQLIQADPMVNMVKPCMPHTIGNLRSMMQTVHMQNSRFPYVGPTTNGQLPVVQPIAVPYNWMGGYSQPSPLAARLNTFQTAGRQQMPPAVHMANGGGMPPAGPTEAPPASTPSRAAAFKSNSLTVGKTYDVCVSFVENGPCLFSVQLATAQDELTKMMNNIERLQFRPLSNAAVLGTACIARYSEDGQLYRALITNVQPAAAKVAYIDYGNAEVVNSRELYEITEEFLQPKAFAIRFTLSGHKELEPMDDSLKKTFKDLVMYKNCKLKVMPLEGPPLVQYCELYLNNQNVLDVLKQVQKCRLDYPKAVSLENGDAVEIRYTDSPKCFFVQKVANIAKFEALMDDMFQYYNKNQIVPDPLKLGSPCMVKTNNEWYRAEILRADSITTTVRFVDYGNEKNVTQNVISVIAEEHLKMPCQAVQCCLKGFENNELNMDLATSQMEMLAENSNLERRRFTAKVFRIQPDGSHLVNLYTKDINLMKKLYKLSMPFEQYLSLEKEDFNLSYNPAKQGKGGNEGSHKSPSIVSSNDQHSQKQAKQWKQQQQQQNAEQQRQLRNSNNQNDWERGGSGDKRDRDSRSNSSDFKRGGKNDHQLPQQQQQYRNHQQPQKENMQHLNGSIGGGSDRRSTGSAASSNWNKNRHQNVMDSPPRSINSNNSNNKQDNRRQTPQKQQKNQRSQNAPQGYSQHSPTKSVTGGSPAPSPNTSMEETSSNAASDQAAAIEYMPLDHAFPTQPLTCPAREEVEISWWESPHLFYTHLKRRLVEFQRLEQDMQKFYKRKTWQQLQVKVGSHVIVRYRKDNCLYRARIVSCNQMLRKYRAFFVDYGYLYMVMADDIWQVERRFAQLPCMAYMCGFRGIVLNQDHLSLVDRMEKYVPQGAALVCDYRERDDDKDTMYYVDVTVNKKSLRDIFKADGIITSVRSDLRLSLLGGQQIMAKLCSIKDMLHFKIETEAFGQQPAVQLLSSYDDVRFVKSNADVGRKFKSFYEGKTLVVNVKEVNNNKVIQLRPLLPLLAEDHVPRICTYPVVFESFDLKVVYVASHYRLYGHLAEKEQDIAALLDDLYEFYEKDNGAPLKNLAAEQVCAAKSSDGNWYRAKILAPGPKDNSPDVHVHFIDYGNDETVPLALVKPLNKMFTAKSSYAIEVNLPVRPLTSDKGKSKKPLEAESLAAKNELEKALVGQFVAAKALEVRQNHLMADIRMKDGKDVIELLRGKKLVKGRDVDYMRKQLEKEKPNMLEYIETVDLTLEDEEEAGEKRGKDQKAKNASPKKKKEKPVKENGEASPVKSVAASPVKSVEAKEQPKPKGPASKPEEPKKPEEKPAQPQPSKAETPQPSPKREEPAPKVPEPEPEPERQPEPDPYADMETAVLSHCDNPAQFFVHPQHKVEQLRKLQENLQIVASSLPPLMRVINGAHCISLYSVDKQWYRAQIIDAELMVLKFIDYGNTDCVTDTTDVKEMSVFPDIEPLCIPCSLPIKPNGTADWVDAANAIFNDSYTKRLHFEYITRGDEHKRSFIKLFIEGVDITAKLIEDGYAKPLVVVDSGENCYISHMNGITDFYIQYEKESKALELIEIHLSQNESFRKLEQFERSKIVAALFPDDSMWYRAKLLKEVPGKGYEVLFIDYGNTSISPECREISEDIAKLPPLSKKCSLELPDNCLSWSEGAEEKFAGIAAAGETIFTVELRQPSSDHALVHLFIDGHNVNDDLEPLCEHKPPEVDMNASFCNTTLQTSIYESGVQYDALVSHVNTPNEFYIQFNKDTGRLEDITAQLNSLNMEPLEKPEVGDLCGAIFPADKAFYRARVQAINPEAQEYRVRFIDFGNEAFTKDLRSLPQDLLELKELSQLCRLDGDFQMNGATVKVFHDIVAACEGAVKVEFLGDCDEEPAVVRLIVADSHEDVAMKLMGLPLVPEKVSKECRISHAATPSNFYIQPLTNAAQMELVSRALLKDEAEKLPKMEGGGKGSLCCVYSKEDELFYRGRIEQVLPEDKGYEVFLLDSGNTIKVLEARQLTEELAALPPLAWQCTLQDLPEGSEAQLEAQFAALLEAHFGETFEIESDEFDASSGVHTVKLQVNYKDLGEQLGELVRKGSQEEVLSPVPTLLDCAVIHVNSPKSFYVQLSRDIEQVQNITDVLLDAETEFEPFADLTVGAICAAQFPDDSAFYRARIVQVLDEGKCEVHYLDFGNNSVTDQFRSLPAAILKTEDLSKHCSLEGSQLATAEAQVHFEAFVDSRFSETFQVEFLKTSSDPQIVRLFYQDKDVAGEVMKLVKSAKAGAAGDAGIPNGVDKPAEESN